MRGGVSSPRPWVKTPKASSPRAWGCFPIHVYISDNATVFPTCVGVFRQATRRSGLPPSLPHVRGGVSIVLGYVIADIQSSPRAWGCFQRRALCVSVKPVFPTCVGVFPLYRAMQGKNISLPHVRGGVSYHGDKPVTDYVVFPTCVGVFLQFLPLYRPGIGLPHVRGGVSRIYQ